ncbi:MFS transporter [Bacillus sp. CGMCC 1.16541]|uniref:MFS transporter n=1 Tax=Bacillus sp. CGMCC 1.16541 TaxID=2185143 RepID=UPI000D73F1EA|nr:MFS transporter [Bacillus sp. CGMCC 1.16541]
MKSWKYPLLLLGSVGISNLGEWIYLLALNVMILDITGSPSAVVILYLIKPFATLCTNGWAGSFIDRSPKRHMMVSLDFARAIMMALLPFLSSLWIIYFLVFFISMASAMFRSTSMVYVTKLIPNSKKKRFNSFYSFINSSGFLMGPAIAGVLFLIGTPLLAIFVNAIALFLSGVITLFMPNVEESTPRNHPTFSFTLIKEDWHVVRMFSRSAVQVMVSYFLFSWIVMIMASALDSLEVAFAKEVLHLSNSEYGFLVSIAGAGMMVGALVNTLIVTKFSTSVLMAGGTVGVAAGYLLFACSTTFMMGSIGFFLLAFALAFANTGFLTFYQTNIPAHVMGRIGSIYGFIEAACMIVMTTLAGIIVYFIPLQFVVMSGSIFMMIAAIALCFFQLQPIKAVKTKGSAT